MATARVDGIDIAYDDHGTGEQVLVLVHGHPHHVATAGRVRRPGGLAGDRG